VTTKPPILVVDDDEDLRTQMRWALSDEYEVAVAANRSEALALLKAVQPGVVTLDLGLPPDERGITEGFALLGDLQAADPAIRIVVVTGRDEREHALQAVAAGACDYFVKPIDVPELKVVLRRAHLLWQLDRERRQQRPSPGDVIFEEMIGRSRRMLDVFSTVLKLAASDVTVLITGESGTGKELAARAIHRIGPRHEGPFVAINCGAIPETLLESELFGHEKGAFTGAHTQREGRIETAHRGTLLLDEIADLPPTLQVKLLRFLQERTVERLGGRATISVDVRLIAATNADLTQLMKDGRIREDLYYRVSVVRLDLPPLRERGEDVLLIANTLFHRFASEATTRLVGFSRDAIAALQNHRWPGNVRELENRVRRAVVMTEGPRVTAADLELTASVREGRALREVRQDLERETIRAALVRNRGNMSRTASELGISRPTLYALLEKLGVQRP
jgi:two-component system NtrC family response regulator